MSPVGIRDGRKIYKNMSIKDYQPEQGLNKIMLADELKHSQKVEKELNNQVITLKMMNEKSNEKTQDKLKEKYDSL